MAKKNPVRGQYMLQGLDLVRAGIVDGFIVREDNQVVLPSVMPAEERWLTSRAVSAAAAKAGLPIDMAAVPAAEVLAYIQKDTKAKVRNTIEHIVHMLGGDSTENRAFANSEIALLEANYSVVPVKKVKAA